MSRPRIDAVETAAVRIVGPSVLVRIHAGEVSGIGECYPSGPVAAIHHIVGYLSEHLLGADPRPVGALAEKLRRAALFTGGQGGATLTALSGIEIALWDLAGKLQGVPVHALLGGAFRDRVRLYADAHAGTVDAAAHHVAAADGARATDPEHCAAAARDARDRGFTAMKFDVDDVEAADRPDAWNRALATGEIDAMVEQVGAIRDAIGREVDLAIDMHARYDLPSAVRAAHALEEFELLWLEEPVPPENLDALAELRHRVAVPVAAGENLYGRYAFRDLLARRAVDVLQPDLAKCGGLAEGRRIGDLAELDYLPVAPHNVSGPVGTIAAAHACAATQNFLLLEFHALDLDHWGALLAPGSATRVERGWVHLTDAPGLGVELAEDVAFAHRHAKGGVPFFGRVAPEAPVPDLEGATGAALPGSE
jgi:galactonate dehydratase